jgi:Na+-driven multidrug efflux pump
MIGTSLYVLGDTILVGRRLGAIGLASLNVSIPLISKAYGKRRRDMKVYYAKIAAFGAVVAGLLITAIGLLIPEYLAMAFVANEPEIIKNAAYGIRLYFLAFPLVGVNLVITIYLQSQKQTTKAFIFSLLRGLILIIILLLILTPTLKIPGVWLVMPITEIIALGVGLILVRNRKLKTR